jgi:hypothetical protein
MPEPGGIESVSETTDRRSTEVHDSHRRRVGASGMPGRDNLAAPTPHPVSPAAHAGATATYRAVLRCWVEKAGSPAHEEAHVPAEGMTR